jgi:hypothetical protein
MNIVTSITVPDAKQCERFSRLAEAWKLRSRAMSNPAQMAMLPEYQQIIGMGFPAVPLILNELRNEPGQWFWALGAIVGENPVPPEAAGDVSRMSQAWIDWGVRNGLITE